MKKINMRKFEYPEWVNTGSEDRNYPFQTALMQVGLFPKPLSGADAYVNGKIADKIEDCENDFLILEDPEYKVIKDNFNAEPRFQRQDGECLRRVLEAEDYDPNKPVNIMDEMKGKGKSKGKGNVVPIKKG